MHRSVTLSAALLTLAACEVKRTPPDFYNHPDRAVVVKQEGEDEIRARVLAFAEALSRGDRAAATTALAPADLAAIVGMDDNGGMVRFGTAGVDSALAELGPPVPALVRTPDLRVGMSQGMGWFSTHLQLLPTGAGGPTRLLRLSGVFELDRGAWRLVQAHLSRAESAVATLRPDSLPRPAAPPSPAADSAADPAGAE
ncbi:MAG TPA: nuclear transport factor 2 family protein [Longimicrobium sp.]|nr:nuclear transport factor 2 family protein [Longimicrobium sp.]